MSAALPITLAAVLAASPMTQSAPSSAPSSDAFLTQYARTRRFLSGRPVSSRITPDGKEVLFLRSGATDPVQALYAFDVASGKTRLLLDAESLLAGASQKLSAEEKAVLERMRISARGFTSYGMSEDGKRLVLSLSGKLYLVERASGKVTPLKTGAGPLDPRFSPDGKLLAYVRDNDVHVIDLKTNVERRVTKGGTSLVTHGLAEFVAQEEMSRYHGYWWSPDSASIVFAEADSRKLEQFSIVDPLHPESGAYTVPYPRPGKENAIVRLGVTSVKGGAVKWLKWDAAKYPYLATVTWTEKAPLTLVVQNRQQTEQLTLAADVKSGKMKTLVEEKDAAWINLEQAFPKWRKDGKSFFHFTERNGGPEVELRRADGTLEASWVAPSAGYQSFVGWDEARETLYFTGSPNPTESLLFRVVKGGKVEAVKTGYPKGAWLVAVLGATKTDEPLVVVNGTTLKQLPVTHVQTTEGVNRGELPEVAEEPSFTPKVAIQKVGAGEGFWSAVIRPKNFKKGQKLPVIVDVYGGPGHGVVKHSMRENLLSQWLADQGFLVVKFDGRGTPGRGNAWERAIKHDFAGPTLDDQVKALQALAKEVPEADLTRVGIQGWSFGGYMSALAVLRRPDVFKVGVSGAPVTEWLDYDTHYTERFLGVPQEHPEAYSRSSLLADAPKLTRPLLLIHGTADDNVYFFHTLKLSDALFRAGKPHDVLPLSGFTHMVADPIVTERLYGRIAAYFAQHLKGAPSTGSTSSP